MLPEPVRFWLDENGFGTVKQTRAQGGGCINNGARIITESGDSFFLKTNRRAPEDMFAREVDGLEALRNPDGPRVPIPYLHGHDFLLLEDLNPGTRVGDYWPRLGRQLAALHNHTGNRFGFDHDNYIGSTPQPNPYTRDGYQFFSQHRLNFQAELAGKRGLLSVSEVERVARLAARLPDLVPHQPPSIIHGDLWSGNIITDERGHPALIDPAAYYGWAEADLAMTVLFGSPPNTFFDAYLEVRPLPEGWRQRFPLYNLYHLLNHLNLFGRGYHSQAMGVLRRFE